MEYIGHRREDGKLQALQEHLNQTAALAADFGSAFGASEHARRTGLLHDVGKTAERCQRRLLDPENVAKVDHSSAGARAAMEQQDPFAAMCIAGHHSGLLNAGSSKVSTPSDGSFCGRMKSDIDPSYKAYLPGLKLKGGALIPQWLAKAKPYGIALYIRMLFSCLVDADCLDTERFMCDAPMPRGGGAPMDVLADKLRTYVNAHFSPVGAINEQRCAVLQQCLRGSELPKGLYTLSVPTGGGKTISSLAFALSHARSLSMERIIYVVPYTSIIEQNAAVFAQILGEENVLEHHCGMDYEDRDDEEEPKRMQKRLAAENWDVPVVVTTAVQFFESLHASRTSACRKLHNLANAVILFDEAQMLPIPFLRPCVASIAELVQHYGSTAVLCTAIQPALDELFHAYAPELAIRELCSEPRSCTVSFGACAMSLPESKPMRTCFAA